MFWNIPNLLTLARIAAIPVVVLGCALKTPAGSLLASIVFIAACVTDFFDGYLARQWHQVSNFGRFLDPIADKLLVASTLFVLAGYTYISGIHLLAAIVILCREIVVSGLREFLAATKMQMPVTLLSKWKTAIQMAALSFLLVSEAVPDLDLHELGLYGLWVAAGLTLITGYQYLRAGLRYISTIPQ